MCTCSTGKMLRTLNVLSCMYYVCAKYNEVESIIILLFTEKEIGNLNSLSSCILSARGASFCTNFYYRPPNSRAVVLDNLLSLLTCQFVEQYTMTIFPC